MSQHFEPNTNTIESPRKRANYWAIIAIVLAVVLLCCCLTAFGLYWLWLNGDRLLEQLGTQLQILRYSVNVF
jgi:hypothetical protein